MSKIVAIRPQAANASAEIETEADLVDLFAPEGFVSSLNSLHITGAQMRAAVDTIAAIPVRSEADIAEHGRLLAAFASDHGFEPAAYAGWRCTPARSPWIAGATFTIRSARPTPTPSTRLARAQS